jgi:hypothetical protein
MTHLPCDASGAGCPQATHREGSAAGARQRRLGDKIRIDDQGRISGDVMELRMKAGARDPAELTGRRGA